MTGAALPPKDRTIGDRRVLMIAALLAGCVGCATALLFQPHQRITQKELNAYCAIASFERANGRTTAQMDSLAKIQRIAIREARDGRLTCTTIGGP